MRFQRLKNHEGNGGVEYEFHDMKRRLKNLREESEAEESLY